MPNSTTPPLLKPSIVRQPITNHAHSYVLLSAFSTFLVGAWHGSLVGKHRKLAQIPYPFEYASYEQVQTASPAKSSQMLRFNSAQRSHQNFNENHVTALGSMLISGLVYPRAAAVLGATWAVNRVVYALGYTNGPKDGKGRYYGSLALLAHYIMIVLAGTSLWQLLK
jgi:glutathione S-transferase